MATSEIVPVKAGETADKVAASKVKRAKYAAQALERLGEAVACGSHVVSLRSHDEHLEALTVHEMVGRCACMSSLSCVKRNTVIEVLREHVAATLCRRATTLPCPLKAHPP